MDLIRHNPASVSPPQGGYSLGLELRPGARLLFISGQIPERLDGSVPTTFDDQCRTVWDNILSVLASAGMSVNHLVKITTYLTDRGQADSNGRIRREVLGEHRPALTVIVAQTLASPWLLEIEAIAAA